jgi:uncharacterized protein YjiS (DUF1127 family)
MSTMSSTTAPSTMPGASGGLIRWLETCANNLAARWVRREAIKALQQLDDRALRDIGISRCHIEAAVGGALNPEMSRFR